MQESHEINSKPSSRYALALFDLCSSKKEKDRMESEVKKLDESLKAKNGLNSFFRNPTYSSIDQENVFKKISEKLKLTVFLSNTVCLMIRKGRGYDLINFSQDFLKLCSADKNELTVHLKTAKKVSDKRITEIKKLIERVTKRSVKLRTEIDPKIIAGLELKVGSFLLNTSLNSQLNSMKNILKRG